MKRRQVLIGSAAVALSVGTAHAFGIGSLGAGMGPFGALLGGAGGPKIVLSNASVAAGSAVGTTIGTLSVVGGAGTYTFTLTSNPGTLFSITGTVLKVAASLTAGSDPITIQANNGAGSIITQPFLITVTPSANGPMDFSVPGNIAITAALP